MHLQFANTYILAIVAIMYPILFFNELDKTKVEKSFAKTLSQLQAGDFKSADVRKLAGAENNYYRARLDIKDRLLFTFIQYNNAKHLLILEVIKNHNYAESRFLRGALLPSNDEVLPIATTADVETNDTENLVYLHPKNKSVFFLNKFISFDSIQENILGIKPPLIIIGSAGSGKTALVLEKLKILRGTVAYISLSSFLVENAAKIYMSKGYNNEEQEVDFLSLTDYLNSWHKLSGKEISFRQFEPWFNKHSTALKINEPYRVFEEFKGVISGSPTHAAYLTLDEYKALGVKQTIFAEQDREKLYALYLKYVDWLTEQNYYDSNLICHQYLQYIKPKYDYIMVDEVQDITNIQLQSILKALHNPQHFILTGDSNQIVHPNFFSWSKVKSYFYNTDAAAKQLQVLQTNYRNSPQVVALSNNLLKIKNTRFGSIDRESNYLINTNSTTAGQVILYTDDDKKKTELNKRTQHSTSYAVIVTDNSLKEQAKKYFKTPLVFSVQEAKGLEYDNVILVNFISNHSNEFKEIVNGVDASDLLQEELTYNRSANKHDKDAEIYKFYINSYYVAITRSIQNIYLFEKQIQHPALQLLQLNETKKDIEVKEIKSTKEEWLAEAQRLEEQGKYEQAEQIRAKYLGYEYISLDDIEAMLPLALDPTKKEQEVKRERKQVFQYASTHNRIDWIEQLAALQFQRAMLYMKEIRQHRKEVEKNVRLGNYNDYMRIYNKYGNYFCIEHNINAMHLALLHGQPKLLDYLQQQQFSTNLQDAFGANNANYLLRGFFKTTILKHQQYATLQHLRQYWHTTKPHQIKFRLDGVQFSINSNSMLYYLVTMMREYNNFATSKRVKVKDKTEDKAAFIMDEFEDICALMPDEVLPAYRKNRTYINSVLAANEVLKYFGTLTGKPVFIRVARGVYALNFDIEWV